MHHSATKSPSFRWTPQKSRAAVLLAEDEHGHEDIADMVGVHRTTLWRWREHPGFAAQVGDHVGRLQAAMLRLPIAKKRKRLEVLDGLQAKLLTVIEERAVEYDGACAGGSTGTVVRQIKQIGSGRDAQIVEEFAVDNGTIRQIMALEEQSAKELGQWVEKSQIEDLTRIVEIVGVESEAI